MKKLQFLGIVVGGLLAIILACLIFFRVLWVTFVDNHELGFVYDKVTGKIEKIEKNGWVVRTPIRYIVHTIDLRPYQVWIIANQRILNAKLVRFNPEGLETFIKWHGRDAGDMTRSMLEILKSYAFNKDDGRDCPFLLVVSELSPSSQSAATKKGAPGQ